MYRFPVVGSSADDGICPHTSHLCDENRFLIRAVVSPILFIFKYQ